MDLELKFLQMSGINSQHSIKDFQTVSSTQSSARTLFLRFISQAGCLICCILMEEIFLKNLMILSKFQSQNQKIRKVSQKFTKLVVLVAKNHPNLKKIQRSQINDYFLVPQIDYPVALCYDRNCVGTFFLISLQSIFSRSSRRRHYSWPGQNS